MEHIDAGYYFFGMCFFVTVCVILFISIVSYKEQKKHDKIINKINSQKDPKMTENSQVNPEVTRIKKELFGNHSNTFLKEIVDTANALLKMDALQQLKDQGPQGVEVIKEIQNAINNKFYAFLQSVE